MKKLIWTILLFLTTTTSVFAQGENKNQLALGGGLGSVPSFVDFAMTIGTLGNTSYNKTSGAWSLQYLRFVTPKMGVGGIVSFEHQSGVEKGLINEGVKEDIGQSDFVIMPAFSCYWYRNHIVGVYSKIAAGVDFISYKGNTKDIINGKDTEFAFQFSPGCVDVGGANVRFFAETGFGYQGIVTMGVHYSF